MPSRRDFRFEKNLGSLGVVSVPVFGRYDYRRAMPGLSPHRHAGAIEICFLVRGRQVYEVAGRRYGLRGGDVFVTFPGEDHSTGCEPEEKGRLFWMVVRDPAMTRGSLLGLPRADSRALWLELLRMRRAGRRHFRATSAVGPLLEDLVRFVHAPRGPLLRVAVRTACVSFLLEVLRAHESSGAIEPGSGFEEVLRAIETNVETPEELTVHKLAQRARLSASRFQAKFKARTGIPPAEYVLRARIAEAGRRLARPGATVTRVAFDLGFSSSQYFAVVFRRLTNRCPSDLLSSS